MTKEYITFIQCKVPNLQVGRHTLNINQEVTKPVTETYSRSYVFDVKGERFSLDKNDVQGVFPAHGSKGAFHKVLPHITLKRDKFPWAVNFDTSDDNVPWLALLVFDEDQQPQIHQGTVQDLVGSNIQVAGYDKTGEPGTAVTGTLPHHYFSQFSASIDNPIQLNVGENPGESTTYIDIPVQTFNAIAPSAEDVGYLAHVRKVDTHNKANQQQQEYYSTIVSNRIPKIGSRSTVHLVSLDGFYNAMPANGTYASQLDTGITHVRMVSFYSWRFDTDQDHNEFAETLSHINLGSGSSPNGSFIFPTASSAPEFSEYQTALAHQQKGALESGDADTLVNYAIAMGYLSFKHETREGGKTVSWYRGPLTPYAVNPRPGTFLPAKGSDELTGYNTATGLFDLSYAAAWQLGQLLAMTNQPVAEALYEWKQKVRESTLVENENTAISNKYLEGNRLDTVIGWMNTFTKND